MRLNLKESRLAYPQLWEPRAFMGEGDARYSALLLLPPSHPCVHDVNTTIDKVAKDKWGQRADGILKTLRSSHKICFLDGALKAGTEGFEGNLYLSASSKKRPVVVDRDRAPLTEKDGKPYAGCYVNAILDIWAQDNQWGKRINATLMGIQFLRDGDAFAAIPPATAEDFDNMGDGIDADALTAADALI